jgi:tetratricopeptide (TPR) repeat protein
MLAAMPSFRAPRPTPILRPRFGIRARVAGCAALVALTFGCGEETVSLDSIRAQQESGDLRGSLAPLEALIDAGSSDPEIHYLYGKALVRLGEPTLAQWSLLKAQEDPAWKVRATLELGRAALAGSGFEAALAKAGEVLAAEPDNLDALRLHAQAAMQTRTDYETALADADRMLALDSGDPEALSVRVVSLLGMKRADEAEASLAELERSVEERGHAEPVAARFCTARAQLSLARENLDQARERFDACLEKFPLDSFLVSEALTFYGSRDPERALAILRTGLEKEPRSSDLRMTAAAYLRSLGRPDEAEALLREATTFGEPIVEIVGFRDLARHFTELGRFPEAADAMQRALERSEAAHAETHEVLFELADALILAGRSEEALKVAERISVPAQRALVEGRARLALYEPARALERFSDANQLWTNNVYGRYFAAQSAEQVGDIDRAIEEYRYALRIDVAATDARIRLARLYLADARPEEALAALTAGQASFEATEEDETLRVRALAELGRVNRRQPLLVQLLQRREMRAHAALAYAEGISAREGAKAAARELAQILATGPRAAGDSELLRAHVRYLAEAGEAEQGRLEAESLAKRAPLEPAMQEILGAALARAGAPVEEQQRAYQGALDLAPDRTRPRIALGLLAAEAGDLDAAREHADRLLAAELQLDLQQEIDLARLLARIGRGSEAESRLASWLRERPDAGAAALRLAELRIERGLADDQTHALVRLAQRFRAPGATEIAARISSARGPEADSPAPPGS